jgi:hypothetical protein
MESCIYEGEVRHRRLRPKRHDFRYSLYLLCLDLAELDEVFRGRWLWSTRRMAPARFRRKDYLGDPSRPLDGEVRALVEERIGRRPEGPIRLLTQLRHLGYGFNPVSFYYCLRDGEVEAVVSEVTNTPWNERHCYVTPGLGPHRLRKEFHVSPFMPMEQEYLWRFTAPGETLGVHMESHDAQGLLFDATLALRRRPITGRALASLLARKPLMTAKVIAAIYFQALRLWMKRVPFHPHPAKR